MGQLAEFKKFALKGNVVDLAVAVVIGAAFGKIVTAVVEGVIMPLVGARRPQQAATGATGDQVRRLAAAARAQ